MAGALVSVKCRNCGNAFNARVADRKRGWGKYCSKSCKATEQTRRTGRGRPRAAKTYYCDICGDPAKKYLAAGRIQYLCQHHADDWVHPFSSEGLGQWDD